jgi:cellulose 1,4-beta-cellobiosidase
MLKIQSLSALVLLLPLVRAAQPIYAQCGGTGYTGDTTCVSGAVCTKLNEFYSQCLPGSAAPTTTVSTPTVTVPTSTATTPTQPGTTTVPTSTGVPTAVSGNPYTGYEIYLSPYYAKEVDDAAAQISDASLKAKALKVKDIPTFTWFDVIAKTGDLGTYLADADRKGKAEGKKYIVQIVVYDLPDRDCAAYASNGEFAIANGGEANYRRYVDQLVAEVRKYPDVRVIAVIEPDSLANMVTNMDVQKCRGAEKAYKEGVVYALRQLSAVGVYSYIDAGHAGWLGWNANLTPAARLYAEIYKNAGSSPFIKGLATNVANYNALSASSPDPVTQGNQNTDELKYINAISPVLRQNGFNAQFIVDQGRSGRQNIRNEWGEWCNVRGAGFGMRPTLNTGSSLIDAIVWVKPGGEADGTSNTSAPRYDTHCGVASAHKPAPEAGTWFQEYFVALVQNANPAL